MQTIWKYPVVLDDEFELRMPAGARLLTVQVQQGKPVLWALVNPDVPQKTRRFRLYGTGQPLPDAPGEYVGSFQVHGGALVFHLFARQ